MTKTADLDAFISKWTASGGSERANYVSFLNDLCDVLGVPHPDATREDDALNDYVYERAVKFHNESDAKDNGRIDLYKRDCFVLEAKQGSGGAAGQAAVDAAAKARRGTARRGTAGWDDAMLRAHGQAIAYARALPKDHGYPPFIIVVDVGHTIDLYADFARSGKFWSQFPDAHSFRITMNDLRDEKIRARLKAVFTDPLSLDPSRYAAAVTRELAAKLADLAKSLEAAGHRAESVATFLMRCLFTLFSEDIGLLKKEAFQHYLEGLRAQPHAAAAALTALWRDMNTGSPFNAAVMGPILKFNGGLFAEASALPLTGQQVELLIQAAKADWTNVEPAIFGTLLERALDPVERHRLGAHYTPRAYVERLVLPTVIEPLREDWDAVRAAAVLTANRGDGAGAIALVREYHRTLCSTRVLDPACGSGNFLYVTLEHMKRLEGEVLQMLTDLDQQQAALEMEGFTVGPHQFLGIEVNVRAAKIAEMVLWIGYLQWHYRTRGQVNPPEPVIRDFKNIECRDAVLAWDGEPELVRDANGVPVTRWDGRSTKKHPVTGEDVPDETKTVPVWRYVNPRKAEWPKAEFVVGNPPYIGARRIRLALRDEYVDALRHAHADVPETVDLVMYWWQKAAELAGAGAIRSFGFITTNSITQEYSRPVIESSLSGASPIVIAFAVADHPWIESRDGAAVRVAMTVGVPAQRLRAPARLGLVVRETGNPDDVRLEFRAVPAINSGLTAGSAVREVHCLQAGRDTCFQGVVPAGDGFKLSEPELATLAINRHALPSVVRRYVIGRDLVQRPSDRWIIDFNGLTESEARTQWPALFQQVLDRVKPERSLNNRAAYRDRWWIFAEPRPALRRALGGLTRCLIQRGGGETMRQIVDRPLRVATCVNGLPS